MGCVTRMMETRGSCANTTGPRGQKAVWTRRIAARVPKCRPEGRPGDWEGPGHKPGRGWQWQRGGSSKVTVTVAVGEKRVALGPEVGAPSPGHLHRPSPCGLTARTGGAALTQETLSGNPFRRERGRCSRAWRGVNSKLWPEIPRQPARKSGANSERHAGWAPCGVSTRR